MKALASFLTLLVFFQVSAFASELRSGIECGTARVIHYRVSGGYGSIDDIIIGTEAQLAEICITMPRGLSADMMPSHPNYGRKSAMSDRPRWPNGIVPFVIDVGTLTSVQQSLVQKAVSYFNINTNLRLILRTSEIDYVNFRGIIDPRDDNFCGRSSLGRIGGYQHIELNPGCVGSDGLAVVLHEIMHALGMHHEHQRSDRDGYVTITLPCAGLTPQEAATNYGIRTTVPFGGYDYASVMHYGRDSCMAPSPITIIPIPISRCEYGYNVRNSLVTDIGQRCALSDGDHAALDYFYPAPALTVNQLMVAMALLQRNVDDSPATLNIDDSTASAYDAASDSLLILRHMFGFSGASLTRSALGATAMRTNPLAITENLKDLGAALDVDNNGRVDALTDGVLILRYMLGLRGQSLIVGAIGSGANPGTALAVEQAIKALVP